MRSIAFIASFFALVLVDRPATAGTPDRTQTLGKIEQVLVVKSMRRLFLLRDGEVLRYYVVALSSNPVVASNSPGVLEAVSTLCKVSRAWRQLRASERMGSSTRAFEQ